MLQKCSNKQLRYLIKLLAKAISTPVAVAISDGILTRERKNVFRGGASTYGFSTSAPEGHSRHPNNNRNRLNHWDHRNHQNHPKRSDGPRQEKSEAIPHSQNHPNQGVVEITLWGWGFGNHNPGGLGGSGDLSGWGGFCDFGDLGSFESVGSPHFFLALKQAPQTGIPGCLCEGKEKRGDPTHPRSPKSRK